MPYLSKTLSMAAVAALCLAATPAAAQQHRTGVIEIDNDSGEERRICFYKNKKINLVSEECFDVPDGRTAIYVRGENRAEERFKVKVFRLGKLLPKYLYSRDNLPGDTVNVRIGSGGGFGYSRYRAPRPPKPEYRVKFCNMTQLDPVWMMIGSAGGNTAISEGFWSIPHDECITINYSERLQRVIGGDRGVPLMTMYRAYTVGENRQTWGGIEDNEDPELCVNTQSRFVIDQWDRGAGQMYGCTGEGEAKLRFRYGSTLDKDAQMGRVNF
ncbi:hypothetical protein ACI5KX_07895 [Erythrobacter sp. GH1-10]|uniref:hypothetical protein n=1 Tax=Erythrobacter sp. GH1-10 TaxID=3349334 RepID=UPI00387825EA